MLTLAVHGRYVQWCNALALLLKGFELVRKDDSSSWLATTGYPQILQAAKMGRLL